jgi:DNA sulfur modification protein DndD
MILDAITLQNFGVYGARQEVILTPEGDGRPIILFGGLNGGGKTTFLDAVQLVFYGKKARISNRGKLSYQDYLRGAIHRGADPAEGAAITIQFRRTVEGEMHAYRVRRSWKAGTKGIEENVDVQRDGEPDSLLSEHWEEYIESYIPSGISHLFFFDAEQIKDLAEGEHAAELLGTAIHSLLGLDLVERLETDLIALERKKKTSSKTGEDANKVRHSEEEVTRLDRLVAEAIHEKAHLTSEADQLLKAQQQCQERFRLEGGDLYLKRDEMDAERSRLEKAVAGEEQALRELAAGAAPLLMILPLLKKTEQQADKETQVTKAQILVQALEERDTQVLNQLQDAKLAAKQLDLLEKILVKDRQSRQKLVGEPCFLHADDTLARELRHLTQSVLPDAAKKITYHLEKTTSLREQLARAETALARVPAEDSVATLQRELESLRVQIQQKKAEVEATEAKLQVLARQHQTADEALKRLLEADADQQIDREDQGRLLKHSAKVRTTLAKFRTTVIRKHAKRIERLMLDSFKQLLRKTSLVSDLKIDPETFQIELTGGDGTPLPFDRLSAGERQLLATSLLWGLARASGRPLPTIIDTPLGRLDSTHRKHLIERYFPVASHQVILLSTDEEIDEDSLQRLQKYVGHSYHLQFDERSRATQITKGYFWSHETTR